jgi:hypothetical protein
MGMADLTIQLGSLEFEHPTVVVENLTHKCLLGSDFFTIRLIMQLPIGQPL